MILGLQFSMLHNKPLLKLKGKPKADFNMVWETASQIKSKASYWACLNPCHIFHHQFGNFSTIIVTDSLSDLDVGFLLQNNSVR